MSAPAEEDFDRRVEQACLAALAEFSAGAGHEINNPVATISGHVQLLLAGETDPERRRMLTTIGGQAYRIRDMISDLMLFARPPEPKPATLNLSDVAREVVQKFAPEAAASAQRLEVTGDNPVPIWADSVQLQVVISSLLKNSLQAMPAGGSVSVGCYRAMAGGEPRDVGSSAEVSAAEVVNPGESAILEVTDAGPGLSELERQHLFSPFFSGRQAGRGLGFGLSKCWRIVTLHGGQIEVLCPAAGGVTFKVRWPAKAPASAEAEPR